MTIMLSEVFPIEKPSLYKAHFAQWNGRSQPLDVFARDRSEWQQWQEYRPASNHFNRPFIFSLMRFYHERDVWLFGGIYQVLERLPNRYLVELTETGAPFIGRLKLHLNFGDRQTRTKFEAHYPRLEVSELLKEPYAGRTFPGFENVDLSFEELEAIVKNGRPDWKAALSSVKGIYLISDVSTGKKYVGQACGEQAIWSRWSYYVDTGHGGNVELRKLASDVSVEHHRKYFRFALLETRPATTPDSVLYERESYWKRVLLTRGDNGFNRN